MVDALHRSATEIRARRKKMRTPSSRRSQSSANRSNRCGVPFLKPISALIARSVLLITR
jgi:hypothetical protein